MRSELKDLLHENLGQIDGQIIEKIFDKLEIADFTIADNHIIILATIGLKLLKNQLIDCSKTGRIFTCTEENETIRISLSTFSPSDSFSTYSSDFSFNKFNNASSTQFSLSQPNWGVMSGKQILPHIDPRAKVLDVGAGDGLNAKRMRDKYHCDVYALEPSFERNDDYIKCQKILGKDRVENLTLQEAIAMDPEKYLGQFDVVTVFKFNVPLDQIPEFIKALAACIKPGGMVHITSVEPERLTLTPLYEPLYLIDILKQYFNNVDVKERSYDGFINCGRPKLVLDQNKQQISATSKKLTFDLGTLRNSVKFNGIAPKNYYTSTSLPLFSKRAVNDVKTTDSDAHYSKFTTTLD